MSRSIVAAGVAAAAITTTFAAASVLPTAQAAPAPAKPAAVAQTKTVCGTVEKLCFTVPNSWTAKRTLQYDKVAHAYDETLQIGSKWTPDMVRMDANGGGLGGWCENGKTRHTRVVKSVKTAAVDGEGLPLYAVAFVSGGDKDAEWIPNGPIWEARVTLTSNPALRTVGVKDFCESSYTDTFIGRNPDTPSVWINADYSGKNSLIKTAKTEKAAIAIVTDAQHRMAFNVLTTARYGR